MQKNKLLRVFSISGIFVLYTYISVLLSIPGDITIVEGATYNTKFNSVSTVDLMENSVLTINKDEVLSQNIGKAALSVKLFGRIPIKTVSVNVVSDSLVVPGGSTIGVKINTKGLTVITTEGFKCEGGEFVKPYEEVDIKRGDVILEVNGIEIDGINSFIEHVQNNNGENIELTVLKNGVEEVVSIKPEKDIADNKYKLGLWVKEVTSGVGTVTFINPETKTFGALGHGINDSDGNLLKIRDGEIYEATILSVIKGQKGTPGELKGAVKNETSIGVVSKNTSCGIYGKLDNDVEIPNERMSVALMQDVEIGPATILANVSGDKTEEFTIEIEKVNRQNANSNKSMVIKITDERLLDKTGGIVQGMSGSPIIQNGKIIGAVTHVLINDPTKGYGIFIENMLKEAG